MIEGLYHVADQVFRVFNSHCLTRQIVAHPNGQTLVGRELKKAHQRRLLHQRLHAAQAWPDAGILKCIDELARAVQVAVNTKTGNMPQPPSANRFIITYLRTLDARAAKV